MEKFGKSIVTTGIAAALAAWPLIAGPAQATPASGFTAVQQLKGLYNPVDATAETDGWEVEVKTKGETDLYVTRNAIAVGGHSGWHRHPGPSLITVTIGEITAYDSDNPLCTPKVYRAGEGFVDSGHHSHILRNESGAPAETIAVQFLEKGATRRIDASKPTNCDF
jgi:quercetin dioxygenase-like cupin family protein